MQVAGQHVGCLQPMMATGARVSNAYPTCPSPRNNPVKIGLIPYEVIRWHQNMTKGLAVKDGDASDWLVGEVTAHQGDDQ